VLVLTVGLWNADLTKSEKGFYAMAFILSLFAAMAIQKNTRDLKNSQKEDTSKTAKPQTSNHNYGNYIYLCTQGLTGTFPN